MSGKKRDPSRSHSGSGKNHRSRSRSRDRPSRDDPLPEVATGEKEGKCSVQSAAFATFVQFLLKESVPLDFPWPPTEVKDPLRAGDAGVLQKPLAEHLNDNAFIAFLLSTLWPEPPQQLCTDVLAFVQASLQHLQNIYVQDNAMVKEDPFLALERVLTSCPIGNYNAMLQVQPSSLL